MNPKPSNCHAKLQHRKLTHASMQVMVAGMTGVGYRTTVQMRVRLSLSLAFSLSLSLSLFLAISPSLPLSVSPHNFMRSQIQILTIQFENTFHLEHCVLC
jgi:hypothetical protein